MESTTRRRFLMLMFLYAQREQFGMDYDRRRLILLTDWYMKHWEQQDDYNQMIR